MVAEKCQSKDKFVLNNSLGGVKRNQITDMIKETEPTIMIQLEHFT